MRRSQVICDIIALAAVLLVSGLVLIAVYGVIERHAKEHGHNLPWHTVVPGVQGRNAGHGREANDDGGAHGVIDARSILSTPLNSVERS